MPKIVKKLRAPVTRGGVKLSHEEAQLVLLALGVVTVETRKAVKQQRETRVREISKKTERVERELARV